MAKVIWTRRSLTDLEDIAEYIAKDSLRYAKITVDMLMKETVILEKNPLIGRIVPEISTANNLVSCFESLTICDRSETKNIK